MYAIFSTSLSVPRFFLTDHYDPLKIMIMIAVYSCDAYCTNQFCNSSFNTSHVKPIEQKDKHQHKMCVLSCAHMP